MNKLGFFAIIMILTALPLAFAQDSEKIRQEYCQKNWQENPDICSDFVIPDPELPTAEERNEALKLQQQIKAEQALPQTKEPQALQQMQEPKNTLQTPSPSFSAPQNIGINQIMGIGLVILAIVAFVIIKIRKGTSGYGDWNTPPSLKQVNYLSVLRYRGPRPNSSREASMIIDDVKHGGDGNIGQDY